MIDWDVSPTEIFIPGALQWQQQILEAVAYAMSARRMEIRQWMQENASWQDVTGAARRGLDTSVVIHIERAVVLYLIHGVHYGKYLETKAQGRYAIIGPAVDLWAEVILNDVRQLMKS